MIHTTCINIILRIGCGRFYDAWNYMSNYIPTTIKMIDDSCAIQWVTIFVHTVFTILYSFKRIKMTMAFTLFYLHTGMHILEFMDWCGMSHGTDLSIENKISSLFTEAIIKTGKKLLKLQQYLVLSFKRRFIVSILLKYCHTVPWNW